MGEHRKRLLCGIGVFLALLGLYLLTSPGRNDIIDGQFRYDVARNWLQTGEPVVTDPYLLSTGRLLLNPRTGKGYSEYNAAPSITPMALMELSRVLPGHNVERDRFAFGLTGPCFGAALGALLLIGYGWLGIGLSESLLYTGVFCLATLWWPSSVTVFDQNQHGLLLLGSVLLAWQAGRTQRLGLAGLAGLLGGLLLNYQEMYALLLPVAGLAVFAVPDEGSPADRATLRQSPDRAALRRYLAFGLGCGVGLGLFCAFNVWRFGTPLLLGKYGHPDPLQPPTWGNPLVGFLSLALSPGKGLLWFSPPLLLACLGPRGLFRRAPTLTLTVVGVSICHLLVIIHLAFFGGDWCWGPRYAIPVMPLWALGLPFAAARLRRPRRWLAPLVAAGLLVQVMAISLDAQRFFYERDLPGFFWVTRPWFYFQHSQLLARPLELFTTLTDGLPAEAAIISPTPGRDPTYCPWSPPRSIERRLWVRHFEIFYLPRPWWGWIGHVRSAQRPVNPAGMLATCAVLLMTGGSALAASLRLSFGKSL